MVCNFEVCTYCAPLKMTKSVNLSIHEDQRTWCLYLHNLFPRRNKPFKLTTTTITHNRSRALNCSTNLYCASLKFHILFLKFAVTYATSNISAQDSTIYFLQNVNSDLHLSETCSVYYPQVFIFKVLMTRGDEH